MDDPCFICLEYTNSRKCQTCTLRCHYECWDIFLKDINTKKKYSEYDFDKNFVNVYTKCPQCSSIIITTTNNILMIISEKIRRCNKAKGTENKKKNYTEMLEYLYKNMWFVNIHNNFKKTVQNKLISFYLEDKLGYGEYLKNMYEKMFGVPIPSEYIS